MQININYDPSTAGAPGSFFNDIAYVTNLFDHLILSPETITINVGYGEVAGNLLGAGALGGSVSLADTHTYADVFAALTSHGVPASVLPTSPPNATMVVTRAEELAIGLTPSDGIAGSVGFSKNTLWAYQPNRLIPACYDFVATVEHEITEVLGRISALPISGYDSVLDLFRYWTPGGLPDRNLSHTTYFSTDHGNTRLDTFNNSTIFGGDPGDWFRDTATADDPFLAFSSSGVVRNLTPTDRTVLEALGYRLAAPVASSGFSASVTNWIEAAITAANPAVTTVFNGDAIPAPKAGVANELILQGAPHSQVIPAGYGFVVVDTATVDTWPTSNAPPVAEITATNAAIIAGATGDIFRVSGNSTVAAAGGNNTMVGAAGGTYLLGSGPGDDVIYTSGAGTLGGGAGNNFLASDPSNTAANLIISDGGADTIVGGGGADTVLAYGGDTLVFGGSGAMVIGANANMTLSGGTGAETVFAGSSDLVFGNASAVTFVGYAGPNTIIGGTQVSTIFGGFDSNLTFTNGESSGAVMAAYQGNETLNAGMSTSNNLLAAGSGDDSLIGGSGDDDFWGGSGNATMSGGAGSNVFNFGSENGGGTDVITDFNSADSVYLIGYGADAAARAMATAVVSGGSSTIQLSDNTRITFLNVTSLGNIHTA